MRIAPVIVTFTNNVEKSQRLIDSAKAYGWAIETLFFKGDFPGFNFKFKSILANISQWRDRGFTHIISVDAFDFIVRGTTQDFLGKLTSLNFPRLILAAETNCYPDKSLEQFFPDTGTRWKFVNSPFILDITQELPDGFSEIGDEQDDQLHLSRFYLQNLKNPKVVLDSQCQFFQTLFGIGRNTFKEDYQNLDTKTYPIFFHGNGHADMSWISVPSVKKVMIGVATAGYTRFSQVFDHITSLQKPAGTTLSFCHGQSPAQARNSLIRQAIQSGASHILLIDDDILVPPDALIKLLAHEKDVVSGLYLVRRWPHQPILFDDVDSKGSARWKLLEKAENGLVPIKNCGLGCVLINLKVFYGLEEPWVRIGQVDKEGWGDDIDFFNRVQEKGHELFADLTVRCGHAGQLIVWPDLIETGWTTVYDTQGLQAVRINQLSRSEYDNLVEQQKKAMASK